jgi:hypothetical protein
MVACVSAEDSKHLDIEHDAAKTGVDVLAASPAASQALKYAAYWSQVAFRCFNPSPLAQSASLDIRSGPHAANLR